MGETQRKGQRAQGRTKRVPVELGKRRFRGAVVAKASESQSEVRGGSRDSDREIFLDAGLRRWGEG